MNENGKKAPEETAALRRRQTELVQALAVESSGAGLARFSTELEDISRRLEKDTGKE